MASRSLETLQPAFAEKVRELLRLADQRGLELLVYCTYRSAEEQARLYRQSRTLRKITGMADHLRYDYGRADLAQILMDVGPQYGAHVTNAAPGMSIHQYGMAIDSVPMRGGKPVWGAEDDNDLALWREYGDLASACGLEWAGNWVSFTEFPHVQDPDADWKKLIRREVIDG